MSHPLRGGLHIGRMQVSLRDQDRVFDLEIENVDLPAGSVAILTGASGSGKTLVLELLGLLRPPSPGGVYSILQEDTGNTDLAALWAQGPRSEALAMARGHLFGFVPQIGGLMPFLSVTENIALPQKLTQRLDPEWCDTLIERLGLSGVAHMEPGALSIGQRQRTAIARSLAHRPAFVIADEPTAALDPDSADAVLDLFLEQATTQNCGIILASHDRENTKRVDAARWHLTALLQEDGQVKSTLGAAPC
ncbi:MAG: ATP-binding cassette domain-containing protein [Paracoccaceae bacterium]